jgi:two-component sensor histidine kinase
VINLKISEANNQKNKLGILYDFFKSEIDKSEVNDFEYFIHDFIKKAEIQNNDKYISLGYHLLSDKYRRIGNYEKALENSGASIKIARNKLSDSLQIIFLNQKANVFKFFDKTDSSEIYFQRAIDLGIKSKQYRPLGYSYNGMASLKMNMGNYVEGITIQLKCLEIAKEHNLENLEISSLIGLGWLYINNEDYDKSIKYLKDAQIRFESLKESNKEQLCDIYRFIGLAHSRKGNLKEGNKLNKKALRCLEETGNLMLAADVSNTIGANYLRNEQHEESIPYFQKLITSAQALNSKGIENFGIINLSSAYIETNQLIRGEKILLRILNDTIDKDILPKGLEKVVYQNLSDLYNRKRVFKASLFYHKKFKHLEDSLSTIKKLKEVTEIDTKYQTEKKEKENLQLKAKNIEQELLTQKANTRNWLLAFGLFALGISSFFIWRRYKSEAKAKEIISKQKNQIEKLQREFHHRIKNDFRSINSFIRLAQKKFPETEFQERLNELKNRVTSMFKVHELLLQQDNITHVKAKPYLIELSENVKQKYDNSNIILNYNVDDAEVIIADKSVPFGVILNEFVTNSYKHAFSENGGNISIDFHSDAYNHYLILKDNGKGLPSDFDKDNLRSFGLEIMPLLAEQYDGEFKLESDNGVSIIVSLPKQIA